MFAGMAADSQAVAAAQFEQETATLGSEQAMANYTSRLAQGCEGLIATIEQFGYSRAEATAFADEIYKISTVVETKALFDAAEARTGLDTYLSRLNSNPSVVSTEIRTFEALIYNQEGIDKKYGRALGGVIVYAGGGIIPDCDPVKRDTVLTPVRKGEGVLVPEVVRALGAGFVLSLNAAGNSGGVSAVQSQFASMGASDLVSAAPQQIVVERTMVEHVPTSVTVKDANNRLIGTMCVVADQKIDASLEQQAREGRKAGH